MVLGVFLVSFILVFGVGVILGFLLTFVVDFLWILWGASGCG